MGKTTDSRDTNTQYRLDPTQERIRQSAIDQYMPNGQLPQGHASVADFSTPSLQAFGATEANFGAQQPTMDAAKGMTMASAGHAGQFQGAPDGWTTGPDGQAHYQDFQTGVDKYMSPFTDSVINRGIEDLNYARGRAELGSNNDSVAKGSFGGTRQAVRSGINDRSYGDAAERLITGNRAAGFDKAVDQYNTGFGQGQTALNYNTGVSQADRAAVGQAGQQLGNQAEQNQRITGNDINALGAVGGTIEARDQQQRDADAANQNYGLQVASSLTGLGPPPSSTARTDNSVSSGSIWGSIGSAAAQGAASAVMLSDEHAKTNVTEADPHDALAEIRKLAPKKFEYTSFAKAHAGAPGGLRTGFMAQDLEKATGEPAPRGAGGLKQVDMAEHLGRLTAAVHALDEKMRKKKAA